VLAVDIRQEEQNQLLDKSKLESSYNLLGDLKGVILQIMRSLSRYGSLGTRDLSEEWAEFENEALQVLLTVGKGKTTTDPDQKTPWFLLYELTGRDLEREISPYVALARHGTELLEYAVKIYRLTEKELDDYDRDYLLNLFQPDQTTKEHWWTSKIRNKSLLVQRYPLNYWMG
jgi:hypothetical protein